MADTRTTTGPVPHANTTRRIPMRAETREDRNQREQRDRQKDRAQALIVNALIDNGPMPAGKIFAHFKGRIPWPLVDIYLELLIQDGRVTSDIQRRAKTRAASITRLKTTYSAPNGDLVSRAIGGVA